VSEMSQGPGWWIASDGKWYPPQEHPDRTGTSAPPGDTSTMVPTPPTVGEHSLITGVGEVFDPSIHVTEARSIRFWILGAVVLVALAVAALVVALESPTPTGSALSTGPTTASMVVTLPRTGQPSFSGTLAGRPLSGVITGKGESNSTNGAPIAEYKGKLGNVPFDLHVSIKPFQNGQISFEVTGTYGSEPVTATARFDLGSTAARSLTVPFNGHVGAQAVNGVATATPTAGNGIQIRATLSVLTSSI